MTPEEIYSIYKEHPSIQTDTRKLQKGDLFLALKGPHFNGNDFTRQALDQGAAYVVADEPSFSDNRVILVNDALETLQLLAKIHREQFRIPFIAITGSNGKTTTKELAHEVLRTSFITYTTRGNLNNHIGIPLTILQVKPDAEIAIIEMGANHLKEIEGYCQYAQPTHGLITNIGKAHLEGFGGVKNVKKGKGELFDYLNLHRGTAFINSDDPAVWELGRVLENTVYYGSTGVHGTGTIVKKDPFIQVRIGNEAGVDIQTNLVGTYNLPNVLAAVCIGQYFRIDNEKIKHAIASYVPSNSRSQLVRLNGNTIILDAYNANPGSMKAAIENFASMQGSRKILLLGDMKELGEDSPKEHAAIISLIGKYAWASVVLVGKNFSEIKHPYLQFENSVQAGDWLKNEEVQDALILVKGSRSVQMEKVLGNIAPAHL